MNRTLPIASHDFVSAISRHTEGSDLPRLVGVFDALLAWSAARSAQLAFRADGGRTEVICFERVGQDSGSKSVFWSAQVTRGAGAQLEIHAPSGGALSAEERAATMETLNAHSREVLVEGDRLRIGFGALKNATGRASVLALMDRLLAGAARPAAANPAHAN
jgi:hypothetical protein